MKDQQLRFWILGALLTLVLALSATNAMNSSRRLDRIENKVDAVQAQYGRIDQIDKRLDRIERQLDNLSSERR